MHYRQTIRTYITSMLNNTTLAGTNVFTMRAYAIAAGNTPAIIVYTDAETAERSTSKTSLRELELKIEVYIKKQNNPDDEIDTITEQIESMIGLDNNLNGLALSVDYEGLEIESDGDGDKAAYVATMDYIIRYRVNNDNPIANI